MKELLKKIFGNPEQDRIFLKFETLLKAMNANTSKESEKYLNLLKSL